MKEGIRQCMAWLHTWTGLIVGWILFFIFVTGTAGYFYLELDRWMRPELPLATTAAPPAEAIATAESYLNQHAPDAAYWIISLPGGRNPPNLTVAWPGGKGERSETLDAVSGEEIGSEPRDTGGGLFLYRMHYQLHYLSASTANLFVGFCTMLMLVAIVSGVITHKQIFRNFFTFRPGLGQRSWLDVHNVLAVLGLPFILMITYTGLLFFMFDYMPSGLASVYGMSQRRAFFQEINPAARVVRAGETVAQAPLGQLLDATEKEWGAGSVRRILVQAPNDSQAKVTFTREYEFTLSRSGDQRVFNGVTGERDPPSVAPGAASSTLDSMLALHEGVFSSGAVRWLYFLSGTVGICMVGTGLVLWTVKRRPKHLKAGWFPFGHQLVERLNVSTIAGLGVAVASYFWANRLLPVGLEHRAAWEANVLFIVWAVMFLHPLARPLPRAWVEQFALAAAAFILLPFVNFMTTDRHLGITLPAGDWALAGCDLTMLVVGVLLAGTAFQVHRVYGREAVAKASSLHPTAT